VDPGVAAVALRLLSGAALAAWSLGAAAHVAGAEAGAGRDGGAALEAWLLGSLALSGALYLAGVLRVWARAGRGHGVRPREAAAFALGWAVLAAALVSPVDAWGARLFSAHMLQHELLMVVAAPLLVLGRPFGAWLFGLPAGWRRALGAATRRAGWRRFWRALTGPLAAWSLHAAALWVWHVPWLFDAALAAPGLHALQHLSFLVTALLFWWAVLGPAARRQPGAALLSLFTTMLHTAALGALLALAEQPWYAAYAFTAPALGWEPLADQQLGGLVMWVPAGTGYVAAALAIAARCLRVPPRPVPLAP
jgi:cytochrome c oxidase assembly factor CtaG